MRPTPPSSNRTCGFPASGSRVRLSPQGYQAVVRCSRVLQAEAFEVSVIAYILRLLEASLAASVHVLCESVQQGFANLLASLAGIAKVEVSLPPAQVLVQLVNQRWERHVAAAMIRHLVQLRAFPLD